MTGVQARGRIAAIVAVAALAVGCATAIDGSPMAATTVPTTAPETTEPTEVEPTEEPTEEPTAEPPPSTDEVEPTEEPTGPAAVDGAFVIPGGSIMDHPPKLDGVGHIIVPVRDADGYPGPHLFGLTMHGPDTPFADEIGFEIAWTVPFAEGCGFDAGLASMILAPLALDDGPVIQIGSGSDDLVARSDFPIYDNPAIMAQPGRNESCQTILLGTEQSDAQIVGLTRDDDRNPLLFWAGAEQLAVDDPAASWFEELPLPELVAGPVMAGDGTLWAAVVEGDRAYTVRIDVLAGEIEPIDIIPASSFLTGELVPTADGVVVAVTSLNDDDEQLLLRYDPSGIAAQTTFPVTVDGEQYWMNRGRVSIDDRYAATYVTGERVMVIDLADGSALRVVESTSFNNNGDEVLVHGGQVVLGPFGRDNWVEAFDAATGEPAWAVAGPAGAHDAKKLTSLGGGGVFVQSVSDDGLVVARIPVG